jgi:hypothetical protein
MLRALLFLLTASLLAVCPAHAEWRRAVTPHFIIYSEGSAGSLYQFAQRLERFDALLRCCREAPTRRRDQAAGVHDRERATRSADRHLHHGLLKPTSNPSLRKCPFDPFGTRLKSFCSMYPSFHVQFCGHLPGVVRQGYAEFLRRRR